jgi:hypothetical protein
MAQAGLLGDGSDASVIASPSTAAPDLRWGTAARIGNLASLRMKECAGMLGRIPVRGLRHWSGRITNSL